jgi:flagellar hook-length control protein FliK
VVETREMKEPPRPAEQIAPAMVSLAQTTNGTERLTVRLDPAELGRVHIQIERSHEAPPRVEITVDRPETMTLLIRDQHDLHRALDQAGVPTEGRSISFQLASQDQQSPGSGQGSAGGSSFSSSNNGSTDGGANGSGSGSTGGRNRGRGPNSDTAAHSFAAPRWISGALDITA